MAEAAEVSDITWEEEPMVAIIKALLSKAQLLMRDTEELLDLCTPTSTSRKSRRRKIALEGQANIEEDGETLIIDGFRFESAVSREERRRLRPLPGRRAGGLVGGGLGGGGLVGGGLGGGGLVGGGLVGGGLVGGGEGGRGGRWDGLTPGLTAQGQRGRGTSRCKNK